MVVGCGHTQLSKGSSEENLVFEYEEEDKVGNLKDGSLENQNSVKCEFRNDMWQNPNFIYDPPLTPFFRCARGPKFINQILPTFIIVLSLSRLHIFGQDCNKNK